MGFLNVCTRMQAEIVLYAYEPDPIQKHVPNFFQKGRLCNILYSAMQFGQHEGTLTVKL
jgi:hypothetical protein